MKYFAKILVTGACSMTIIISCNDNNSASPYEEILEQKAFAAISDSIKKDPSNDQLRFRRAVLLNTNNFPEPALADFQKAWSLKKEEKYALGISTLLLEKKADSAILFLQEALKEIPRSYLLRLSLARGYTATSKTREALAICDEILSQKPDLADVIKLKADLLDKENKTDEATRLWEQAYQLAPFDVELNYILALRYAEAKNPRVLALCDSLIKADTEGRHAEPYYYKGIYYANINDNARAITSFDEAIQHDFYFLDGYIEKGSLLYEMKKYEEAIAVFNLALTISPSFADAYYWIAKCQQAMGKKEEARVNYLRAFELDKTMKEAREAVDSL
ncbi:MAG: tetratricopeptide repeat protein [Chitinophagaceae bacterium]|nr:tetratricopeptide repeat protein [Chitinophagaceae bacterium]